MKISIGPFENRTPDLPTVSAVSQPTAPSRTLTNVCTCIYVYLRNGDSVVGIRTQ